MSADHLEISNDAPTILGMEKNRLSNNSDGLSAGVLEYFSKNPTHMTSEIIRQN